MWRSYVGQKQVEEVGFVPSAVSEPLWALLLCDNKCSETGLQALPTCGHCDGRRLLDRYDCKIQYKGGMRQFTATNNILTSLCHTQDWYPNLGAEEGKMDQLMRRIDHITHLPM